TLSGDDPATGFLYDFSFPREGGNPNPHLWMNPQYAKKYAQLTAGWLAENDPANKANYDENLKAFEAVIDRLDAAIRTATATVPEKNRKLLTYHDSWAYWAREYGWTVIGAIQPSDFSEPSAKDVADLIDEIKQVGVPAVFGSEVFPSPVTEQIARETGAKYVTSLSDDEPPAGAGAHVRRHARCRHAGDDSGTGGQRRGVRQLPGREYVQEGITLGRDANRQHPRTERRLRWRRRYRTRHARHRPRPVRRRPRAERIRKDDAAAGAPRHRRRAGRAGRRGRPAGDGAWHGAGWLRAPVADGRLELPRDRRGSRHDGPGDVLGAAA